MYCMQYIRMLTDLGAPMLAYLSHTRGGGADTRETPPLRLLLRDSAKVRVYAKERWVDAGQLSGSEMER